tara:strand:+ start:2072 stop:2668 length:597 start_codon:yes stop_codon:yes gene_type:complete
VSLSTLSSKRKLQSLEAYQEFCDAAAELQKNHAFTMRPYYVYFTPLPGSRILDIGSYVAANLCRYAPIASEIVGIEAAQAYIDSGFDNLKGLPEDQQKRVRVICGLVEDQEFAGDFDYVICTELLLHVIDPVAVLCKVHEALTEEGQAFLTIIAERQRTHVRGPDMALFQVWCHEAGLEIDRAFTDMEQHIIIARRAD